MRFTIILLSLTLAGCESADVGQIGAMLSGFGNGVQQHEPAQQPGRTIYLTDARVTRQSRICTYNDLNSPYVITLPLTEVCPTSLER